MTTYIYLITRNDVGGYSHEEAFKMVVIAPTEEVARALAADRSIDEGREEWTDSLRSSCWLMGKTLVDLQPGVVVREDNAS